MSVKIDFDALTRMNLEEPLSDLVAEMMQALDEIVPGIGLSDVIQTIDVTVSVCTDEEGEDFAEFDFSWCPLGGE